MDILVKKVSLFLISAGVTGLLYIGVLYLLVDFWHNRLYVGVAIAYLTAMFFYFIVNRIFVFRATGKAHRLYPQIVNYSIMLVVNYLITFFLVWLFFRYTGEIYSGSVAAGIVTTLVAYLVFNRIFK
jgi:putative flippase GtrA